MWHINKNPFDTYRSQLETENFLEEQKRIDDFIKSANQQADYAKLQFELALREAESAKRDAMFSKIVSIISIVISILALVA